MNADHEEAVEFAKISKRENRVYVGNLSYEVRYRDLMEFMRGGGWGNLRSIFRNFCGDVKRGAWQWAMLNLAELLYSTQRSCPFGRSPSPRAIFS